jgi:uncharacterized protein YndB with AHSA1/START domain
MQVDKPKQFGDVIESAIVHHSRELAAPPDRVWRALTTSAEISELMDRKVTIEPRVGGRARFFIDENDQAIETVVVKCEPERLLEHTWEDSLVRWELRPSESGTTVDLAHIGLVGEWIVNMGAGWHAFLDDLANFVEGRPIVGPNEVCQALVPYYAEHLAAKA